MSSEEERKAGDLDVIPMFSDHDVIKAAKAEAERMNAHQAEEQRKIASTIPESAMPCPRLELRWVRVGYETRCDYNIVIPINKNDIREGSPVNIGSELRFCMGFTTTHTSRDGHPLWPNGVIDTPYRDGKHAAWDSHRTGFPAFVVWQGQAQSILPEEPNGEPIEDDPPDEKPGGGKDWAHRSSSRVLNDARDMIKRHAFKVQGLRDGQQKGSWPWLYFDWIYETMMVQAKRIDDDGFTDFEDWVRFRTSKINIGVVKRVCSKCGADVPRDITQACEHVYGDNAREFAAKE